MQRQVNKSIAMIAVFTSLALILSYIEAVSGINNLLPVAGTKLGLANIAVTVVVFLMPFWYGATVSLTRVFLSSLLFGSVTGLIFSLGGAVFALLFLLFSKTVLRSKVSMIGTSVGASALHMVGQLLAASVVLKSFTVFNLLPVYLLIATVTGVITGIISQILYTNLKNIKVR